LHSSCNKAKTYPNLSRKWHNSSYIQKYVVWVGARKNHTRESICKYICMMEAVLCKTKLCRLYPNSPVTINYRMLKTQMRCDMQSVVTAFFLSLVDYQAFLCKCETLKDHRNQCWIKILNELSR
jgi:hypothetical protein